MGVRFQVKRIMVKPGEKLSLQIHHQCANHWIVVSGTVRETRDGFEELLSENKSVCIPLGATHRLENLGRLPLHLIEVQSSSYLCEGWLSLRAQRGNPGVCLCVAWLNSKFDVGAGLPRRLSPPRNDGGRWLSLRAIA